MSYDVAFRHRQALYPDALTTLPTAIHTLEAAISDCRNAGIDVERDPAVLLPARHLGAVATDGEPSESRLRQTCMDATAELRRRPALLVLAYRSVGYDTPAKTLFHADGRRAMRSLAEALRMPEGSYDIRSNHGGLSVSGEITLHSEELYVNSDATAVAPTR